jgi:Raf kinase inhibitor-like YbhB/YbcL family protein
MKQHQSPHHSPRHLPRHLRFKPLLLAALTAIAPVFAHAAMSVDSPAFKDGGELPAEFAGPGQCGGKNVSVPISWHGLPATTKSVVVTLKDPDGPKGTGVTHWVAYGIDPSVSSLDAGSAQSSRAGVTVGKNFSGSEQYRGPCPPVGDAPHHYILTVTATDLPVGALPAGLDTAALTAALNGHTLTGSTTIARYGR